MKHIIRLWMISLLVWHHSILVAAEPVPMVDAKVATVGDIWQGQRVIISLTVKTPDTFASEPIFDLPTVPGMILVPPTGRPVVGTEDIGEDSFTTQSHEMSVIPQQTGKVTIVPFPIRFDSTAGFGKPVHSRTVVTPELSFSVQQPPGTASLSLVLTTTNLNVTEAWKPEPDKTSVAVGGAFTRTINITADDLPGIVLPSFLARASEGLRVYNHAPELDDQDNRGDFVGHKVQTATFIGERPGQYEIPPMSVSWWNPKAQKLRAIRLSAHTFTVTAPPPSDVQKQETATAASPIRSYSEAMTAVGILVSAIGLGRYFWPMLRQLWYAHERAVLQSEQHAFRIVVQACHAEDAHATYRTLLAWREKFDADSKLEPQTTADEWRKDDRLAAEIDRLESSLYGKVTPSVSPMWSSKELLKALTQFRSQQIRRRQSFIAARTLPELNPST